jgi:predicted permease
MWAYRFLLHAYPSSFRAEYGEEMCEVYAQRRRDASSILLVLALWLEVIWDTLGNAAKVHYDLLWNDLRYALRMLRRSPGFAFTAIAVAALGIGATTSAFTMIDHVLIRPLPFADQERLVKLFEDHSSIGIRDFDVAPANFRDWKSRSTSFESMGAYTGLFSKNLVGQGEPQRIETSSLTADVLPTLGVKPMLGRFFTPDDDHETAPGTLILSYGLWTSIFGGDAGVLGRTLLLDDTAYTIIGVMPRTFYFPDRNTQLWTPMRFTPGAFQDRTDTYLYGVAKLKPGVSVEMAAAEMRIIGAQLASAYPKELSRIGVTVMPLRDDMPERAKLLLKVLLAASLCVLLVACTNLANLLMARALARRKELAMRAAMGAGRERLIRQMLTESLLLAAMGGTLGVLLARLALPLLVRLVPIYLPIAATPSIDLRILSFAVLITSATGIAFGMIPALQACRGLDAQNLREGGRSGIGGRNERLRSALVVAEVAGSVVLLVSCGLLIRALWRIHTVDPGFRAENVLTLRTSLPMPKYEGLPAREKFYQRVLIGARALPGVTDAAYTSFLPMVMRGGVWPVEVEGRPRPISERQNASLRFVTPGFFSTMGIPLLAGRDVAESDTPTSQLVAVISESFVHQYWPGQNTIGRRFNFGNHDRIVAGVVGDVRVRGLESRSEPQVYLPYKQCADVSNGYAPKDLAIRASGSPAGLAPALGRIIREADPEQPISNVRLLSDIVEDQTGPRRVQVIVLGAFAAIAFLLAAIGIHGVLSFSVSSRTQEIGVRMALGAQASDVLGMVLRDGAILALIGVVTGVGIAYAAGLQMQALLAGVRPGDLWTFASAVILCFFTTLVGSLLPAVRAARVDPTIAIRSE